MVASLLSFRPRVHVRNQFDLGRRKIGDIIRIEIEFGNRGWLPLTISPKNSSCGFDYTLKDLTVWPGESTSIPVSMLVRDFTDVNDCEYYFILQTNDPLSRQVHIRFNGTIERN